MHKLAFWPAIVALFFSFESLSQFQGDDDYVRTINSIFVTQSREEGRIEMDQFCTIKDFETNDQTYKYSLKHVVIEKPKRDKNTTGYEINVYCADNLKCIYLNNRKFISYKDFELLTEEGANEIYTRLIRLQTNCN